MINLKIHKFLFLAFCLILYLLCVLSSCSSSKSTTLKTGSNQLWLNPNYLESLEIQKKKLNKKSVEIVKNLNDMFTLNKPQNAAAINGLFQNLAEHYKIDSIYVKLHYQADKESLRLYGLKKLMESADFYTQVFYQSKPIRRIINRGDKAHNIPKHSLEKSMRLICNNRNREIANQNHWKLKTLNCEPNNFPKNQKVDHLEELTYEFAGFCSEAFSRVVTKIKLPKKENESLEYDLIPHLQKWDIVCQKSTGCATDLFIPGYFGHAGIYLGNNIFVECTQKGVNYSSATDFFKGSDFIVIRRVSITSEQENYMTEIVKAQIGKKYDYNFNTESPDRLTCTELIYLVYDNINWTNRDLMNWRSIFPDDLVNTSIKNKHLIVPLFINRDTIIENPEKEIIENLLVQN